MLRVRHVCVLTTPLKVFFLKYETRKKIIIHLNAKNLIYNALLFSSSFLFKILNRLIQNKITKIGEILNEIIKQSQEQSKPTQQLKKSHLKQEIE